MFIRILLILLSGVLLSGCFPAYFEHWERMHRNPQISSQGRNTLTGNLIILPDKRELENLIGALDRAKERIWVETYTWTEKETQEAVIRAKSRGVDIRVLLEGNVYQTPRINDSVIKRLQNEKIDARYTSDAFSFTHMKLWIIDQTWCISTGNWSYTSFTKNREFIFCSEDRSILRSLEEIFLSDQKHIRPIFRESGLDDRIGLAPLNLRDFLEKEITVANDEIIVFNQTVSDRAILELLSEKMRNGVTVEVCQSNKASNGFDSYEIPSYTSNRPYLHAKIFLIDNKEIILGSANMTQNALDNNREIMIKIENNDLFYNKIKNLYNTDCKKQR